MKRYDRTWPLSFAAIAVGGVIGWSLLGPHHLAWDRSTVDRVALNEKAGKPAARVIAEAPPEVAATATDVSELALEFRLAVLRSAESPRVRRSAAIYLGSSGDERVLGAMMVALRTDPDAEVRIAVAEALGRLGSPVALASLHVAIAADQDVRVREAVAAALRKVGDDSSMPVLERVILTDPSKDVRDRAAMSLGWLEYGAPAAMDLEELGR